MFSRRGSRTVYPVEQAFHPLDPWGSSPLSSTQETSVAEGKFGRNRSAHPGSISTAFAPTWTPSPITAGRKARSPRPVALLIAATAVVPIFPSAPSPPHLREDQPV